MFHPLPALLLLFTTPTQEDVEAQIRRFAQVYAAVEDEFANPIDPDKAMYEGAIRGMLRRLDPHSVFFTPDQFEQLKQLQESKSKGFGTVVSVLPGRVIVLQTLAGTPSARAGMEPGDEIMAINGIRLDRLHMQQLIAVLGQSRQKVVNLDVRRSGNARILHFVLTPQEMQSPSVDRAFFVRAGVGYIRVISFDAETGGQLKEAIEKLGGDGLRALVLDLRNNPGGLLPVALTTASLFLKPGQTLLSVRGRAVPASEQKVPEAAEPYTFPVAVLVNERSASASEIVAGSLQDHDRAVIVGEPTFGKGLVESVYRLSEGTGLALTTAFYYTPSGRSIQKPLKSGQLDATTDPSRPESEQEFRTDSGRIVKGGGGIQPDHIVYQEALSRLQMVLDASGSFTSFATEYIRKHAPLSEDFEVTPDVLDEFQAWLSPRNIRPGVADWSLDRRWIQNRLRAEIFNQALGVEKGDEVEAQRDPQILAALKALGSL
jgi:carboxyl-terminal processing protease